MVVLPEYCVNIAIVKELKNAHKPTIQDEKR